MKEESSCAVCYKIICKKCGWEASSEDVLKIQQEIVTACPLCGWQPKEE